MGEHEFTFLSLASGSGLGTRGFQEASSRLGSSSARFRSLGGGDNDPEACADFEYLTGSPALCADMSQLSPGQLRAAFGDRRPDAVFSSPPCKGFSGLLSNAAAASQKYQDLNRLVLQSLFLVCEAWDSPPPLLVIENVPRIQSRGAHLLRQVRQLLSQYGYVFHESTHDCGEIGGLAQHRRRFLLVARRPDDVPAFVYQPPRQRVRWIGEVLEKLPLPEDPSAGPLHKLPRLSWLTWLRLALIPAGGDWRDLPRDGVVVSPLADGTKRREHFARYNVRGWDEASGPVTGEGSNGAFGVADPRVIDVALKSESRPNLLGVRGWGQPALAITGSASVSGSNGAAAVADPRVQDVSLGCTPRAGAYGVLSWQEAAGTITGSMQVDNGPAAVADPRPPGDHRYPIIISADGTWHRPLTALELAALQGLPATINGKPLQLAGQSRSRWIERIGNGVPVGAAKAIGESMLTALLAAALGTWTLGATEIWVQEDRDAAA